LENTIMFPDTPTGVYIVKETIPSNLLGLWNTTSIVCINGTGQSIGVSQIPDSKAGGNVTFTLEADDEVVCTFVNESLFPSRTQGFWKTHTNVTMNLFDNPPEQDSGAAVKFTNGTIIIGSLTSGKTIDNKQEIFGLYMASNSWQSDKKIGDKSDGTPRTAEEQTNIIMIHQLLTAKLNCGQFSCPLVIQNLINECDEAFASGNLTKMAEVQNPFNATSFGCTTSLDDYNNSGEVEWPFPPGATPSLSRDLATSEIDYSMSVSDLMLHEGETGISRWDMPFAMNATINVTKNVITDDGGNETPEDFAPYTIDGNPVSLNTLEPATGGTDGNHTVAEQLNENYTQSFSDECPGGIVSLVPEQTKDCIITNDDIAPTLKLVKMVNNTGGGTFTSGDWTLFANATTNSTRDQDVAGDEDTFYEVFSNDVYILTESITGDYSAGDWFCDGGSLDGADLTLGEGETDVTCSIENTFNIPP